VKLPQVLDLDGSQERGTSGHEAEALRLRCDLLAVLGRADLVDEVLELLGAGLAVNHGPAFHVIRTSEQDPARGWSQQAHTRASRESRNRDTKPPIRPTPPIGP